MHTTLRWLASLSALAAAPALAQDAADPPPAVTINGTATLVSDYRFRGISQTDKKAAVQGSFTVSHESGLYASVWGSSIDDYVAAGSDQEIDFILGFKKVFGGATVDVGVLYYYYPGAESVANAIGEEFDSDFFEPYVAVSGTLGPATAKVTLAYAPKQSALDYGFGNEDSLYLAGDLSAGIPNTPISLSAHLGRSFQESYLTGGVKYTDWALGASYTYRAITAGVQYVDTDTEIRSPLGRNITSAGVVATLGVSF